MKRDSPPPSGPVTFLFTDIEGSTPLWEQQPEAMQVALARHDALLRQAIEANGGWIVKSTGDGVLAAFAAADDALRAGVAAQRALQSAPAGVRAPGPTAAGAGIPLALKVRMGLHTGVAELRDGDYYGAAVNRAARIMAVAHGGQLLLSAETAALVRGALPEGVALRDMGEHRLKGILHPGRLLQALAPDLRADFPPLASFSGHSLPAERDSFIGRAEVLAKLQGRFDYGARLVSVLGVGGTGKTRLVTRFG
ncbi:MAG: adenylate/guanylate cyclase domain-containing protein [Betaproteobacteria bacterium]|nr:adenylate/guanylate cyclase domain-containing protein [Betaproteobacteria bacterium]